ncbi:unnamed protein product, partial [Discosporangium mesarthrocarpum]
CGKKHKIRSLVKCLLGSRPLTLFSPPFFQADMDHAAAGGETPSILAARGGHLSCLDVLEEAGADLDRPNAVGMTPLITASMHGRAQAVAFLAGLQGI